MFNNIIRKNLFLSLLLLSLSCFSGNLAADVCGKFDFGPAYLHIDVLQSGHTIQTLNMPGLRIDSTVIVWKGVCVKPFLTYGGKGSSQIYNLGCGVGHYTPIGDKCSITPSVGVAYTNFKTHFHVPTSSEVSIVLEEQFQSISPYVGIDASYCFYKGWRLVGSYQYLWSFSQTEIKGQPTTNSQPKGSCYGLMVEYDVNNKWSINLGAAYNISLTKEKHGLRGYGARLGFAYWF
ncbi:MAG: hypothetical protein WCG42_09255 [Parachlamydiaceae bacterium]